MPMFEHPGGLTDEMIKKLTQQIWDNYRTDDYLDPDPIDRENAIEGEFEVIEDDA